MKVKENSSPDSNATGLANPFANKEQINEKIKTVLDSAIDGIFSTSGLTFTIGPETHVIKCTFPDNISTLNALRLEGLTLTNRPQNKLISSNFIFTLFYQNFYIHFKKLPCSSKT